MPPDHVQTESLLPPKSITLALYPKYKGNTIMRRYGVQGRYRELLCKMYVSVDEHTISVSIRAWDCH